MANTKQPPKARGRVIYYDRVPDDVMTKIQDVQIEIMRKTGRARVSVSEAITKLIRKS